MIINGKTDVGVLRSSNQDDFKFIRLSDRAVFAVVCDGMGGANAGNIASQKATEIIVSFFERSYREGLDAQAVITLLQNAISSANMEIYDMAQKNADYSGMGTTVVATFVCEEFAVISHVGDSRAYLVDENVTQLTKDHSVVQSLVESGKLTHEEAKVHPRRNVITRALGIEPEVLVDSDEVVIKNGESLLLCTDGFSNFVSPDETAQIFYETPTESIAEVLVQRANENGGADNITVVTVTL